ncbi:MAG: hypothetical protein C4291_11615 [Candidatus Dadabacteria bacterium]
MPRKVDITSLFCGLMIAGIILFTASCGSQRTFQTKSSPTGFRKYIIVEIPDFKMSSSSAPTDATWKIPNEIAERLKKEDIFTGVSRSPVSINDGVLVVDGTLDFTPAPWYERIVATQRIIAHVRFINKSDNSIIAEATFEGTSKGGIVSGGLYFAYMRLADEIVDYIKLNYSS